MKPFFGWLCKAAEYRDPETGGPILRLAHPAQLTARALRLPINDQELLQGSSSRVLQVGAEIARGHHEKFDGCGYPGGPSGTAIALFSRIVAAVDVLDA